MADIRRLASPMSLCEEDLFDVNKAIEKKKKQLKELQRIPASFFVGSIDVVNERISNLDSALAIYDSKLAIESQASYSGDVRKKSSKSPNRLTRSAKVREERDSKRFEGIFSTDSDLIPDTKSLKRKVFAKKSDEPKLVELQQYPGFTSFPTPLPHSLETNLVIDHVVEAQIHLQKKPRYKKFFMEMMYSKTQRAILQDTFWWFFLNKFHPDKTIQSNLFKRIARLYVSFLFLSEDSKFRHVFFMNYASVLSQSIYSAFCLAFPQSWRQFDEASFKETVIAVTTMWTSGIRPRPRTFDLWTYSALEPTGMRKDESISGKSNEKPHRRRPSPVSSGLSAKTRSAIRPFRKTSAPYSNAPSSVSSSRAKSIGGPTRTLTSIAEGTADEKPTGMKTKETNESCAAGRTIEFDRCVFNLHGGSPLLAEYLRQRKLDSKTGIDHLVRRTQISTYPAPDVPTFNDIIHESNVEMKHTSVEFNRLHAENEKACNDFTSKQAEEQRVFNLKSSKLLAKPQKVKNLSNLILMEMKRDSEELNLVGAAAALHLAMASETAN